eukprot:107711-Chlamydomonas_euryale.AAC.1
MPACPPARLPTCPPVHPPARPPARLPSLCTRSPEGFFTYAYVALDVCMVVRASLASCTRVT